MDSGNNNDMVDETLAESREQRIRRYAQNWYEYRLINKIPGNEKTDWAKAEHIVDAEDRAHDVK